MRTELKSLDERFNVGFTETKKLKSLNYVPLRAISTFSHYTSWKFSKITILHRDLQYFQMIAHLITISVHLTWVLHITQRLIPLDNELNLCVWKG